MINELNQMIEKGALQLAPFAAQDGGALSVNRLPSGVLFALAEDDPERLRLYTNAAPVTAFIRESPEALLNLLMLAGPASAWPELRLGADRSGRYIWISCTLSAEECRDDRLPEALAAFLADADSMRRAAIDAINEAAAGRRGEESAEVAPQAPAPAAEPLPEEMTSESVSDFIASQQVFWG